MRYNLRFFLGFFTNFDRNWRSERSIKKTSSFVRIVMKHNRTKFRSAIRKTRVQNDFAVERKLSGNYSLGLRKSSIHWSSTIAGVSYNTLLRLAEQHKWHGPLPLVHAIMSTRLVSNISACWPIYGLNTNYIDFNVGIQSLWNNASPTNTNNAHISRTTTRTPKISSPMCSPCSCCHVDTFSVENINVYRFYCPKVEFHAFSWHQLV